jgi:hypothetical protein
LSIVFLIVATQFLSSTSRAFAVTFVLISISLSVAEASRTSALYCMIALVSFVVMRRYLMALISLFSLVALLLYSLEARSNTTLGLMYVGDYVINGLATPDALVELALNVACGLHLTSAAVNIGHTSAYDPMYIITSLFPTLDTLDGFQALKIVNEQRIAWYIPFSSFAEIWLFGFESAAYFWCLLLLALYRCGRAQEISRLYYVLLSGIFILGWMVATQYPVRNAIRYFYAVLVLDYLYRTCFSRQRKAVSIVSSAG